MKPIIPKNKVSKDVKKFIPQKPVQEKVTKVIAMPPTKALAEQKIEKKAVIKKVARKPLFGFLKNNPSSVTKTPAVKNVPVKVVKPTIVKESVVKKAVVSKPLKFSLFGSSLPKDIKNDLKLFEKLTKKLSQKEDLQTHADVIELYTTLKTKVQTEKLTKEQKREVLEKVNVLYKNIKK
jgi:hypothetical protein